MQIIKGLELPFGIKLVDSGPVDSWSGPFTTTSDALESIPKPIRFLTMQVRITGETGGSKMYWFKDGVEDTDLIPMIDNSEITAIINSEISARTAGDILLYQQITGETENRLLGDATNYNLITGLTETITHNQDLITGLTQTVIDNYDLLTGETQNRIIQDTYLNNLITGLTQTVESNYNLLTGETENRTLEDIRLNNLITGETENRTLEDLRLNDLITGETSNRIAADVLIINTITGLTQTVENNYSLLTGETENRTLEDLRLNDLITGETESRISGDLYNYNLLTGETENRTLEDLRLNDLITGETSNRIAADVLIINTITGLTQTVENNYSALTGETENRISGDLSNFSLITGLTNTVNNNYNTFTGHTHNALYTLNGNTQVVYVDEGGSVHIDADIYQSGSTYDTHAEKIYTKNDYIILRENAIAGLSDGEYSGIEAIKYDGTNNGRLVFDNTGTARVGDVGFEQPLATREETPTDDGIAIWDAVSSKFETVSLKLSEISLTGHTHLQYLTGETDPVYQAEKYLYSLTGHTHSQYLTSILAASTYATKATTLAGYGITDAQGGLNGTGFVKMSGTTPSYVDFGTSLGTVAEGHLHPYLSISGGTVTGDVVIIGTGGEEAYGLTVTGGAKFNSSMYNKTLLYSPDVTDDLLNIRRYGENHTLINIMAPPQASWGKAKDATLALVRGNNNEYFMDIYNMDYGSVDAGNYMDYGLPQMGIRLQKRGTGIYTPFYVEYGDGTDVIRALEITPRTSSGSTNDTMVNIANYLTVNGKEVWHTGNLNPANYLPVGGTAVNSETLDGHDSSYFAKLAGDITQAFSALNLTLNGPISGATTVTATSRDGYYIGSRLMMSNYSWGGDDSNVWLGGAINSTLSGTNATQGNYLIAIGVSALGANTTGRHNDAIGDSALYSNTAGNFNIGIGAEALYSNTVGQNNIALGYQTLHDNIDGGNNTAIGYSALHNNKATSNTAVGYLSLNGNTTGNNNSSIGTYSLYSNTTGYYNVGVGYAALYSNITGATNTAIGYQAGRYVSTGGDNSIAGASIYIGYESRPLGNNEVNEIVIGSQANGHGSNTTTIGNSNTLETYLFGNLMVGYNSNPGPYNLAVSGTTYFAGNITAPNIVYSSQIETLLTKTGATETYLNKSAASGDTMSGPFTLNNTLSVLTNTVTGKTAGASTIYSLATSKGNCMIIDYTVYNTAKTALRSGTVMCNFTDTAITYKEDSTADLNSSTEAVAFVPAISGSDVIFQTIITGADTWNFKLSVRYF